MKIFLSIIFQKIKKIFKFKKEFIIFQCHHPKLYCDNTRYLYEYLNKGVLKIVIEY